MAGASTCLRIGFIYFLMFKDRIQAICVLLCMILLFCNVSWSISCVIVRLMYIKCSDFDSSAYFVRQMSDPHVGGGHIPVHSYV